MSKFKNKNRNERSETQTSELNPVTASDVVEAATTQNNFAQAAEKIEAAGIEPIAPVEATTTNKRGVLPDAFGNNVKGERICSVCGIKESETLKENPRYSFCKGKCVHCYGKTERKSTKPTELTIPQLEEKIAYYKDLLQKKLAGAQGLTEGNAAESNTNNTVEVSIESHGANVAVKVDDEELAEVTK
jgi:hypothetical protein